LDGHKNALKVYLIEANKEDVDGTFAYSSEQWYSECIKIFDAGANKEAVTGV